ncbi:MAG: ornithine cyclodeaminase family protein [Synergistales bacterium]|nr:ornithine cyclodeaminase family protein [Synergistales bacterium]
MLMLSRKDILDVFTMRDAIEADRKAFCLHSEGKCDVPLRSHVDSPEGKGQCLFMPAYAGGDIRQAGIKIVSVFPGNASLGKPVIPATMLLIDGQTGEVFCIMDGTTLTQLRTAAVPGVATELLSREDSSIGALFGTGGQAPAQMEALMTVRKLKELRIFDMNQDKAALFVETHQPLADRFDTRLIKAETSRQAVDNADVITTVTTSPVPVFEGSWVKPGAHVNAVGSYTPEKRELPSELISRAGKIFVDNMEAVLEEAGDLLIPISEDLISQEDITGELGDIILGRIGGRTSEEEITVMKTVGFATLDVVTAWEIYLKAKEAGVGRDIALSS